MTQSSEVQPNIPSAASAGNQATKRGRGRGRKEPVPLSARLAARLFVDAETGCHNWIGGTSIKGYGRMHSYDGRTLATHRVAYEIANGLIPDGLVIDHLCRNPPCCNPAHLEAVTSQENTRRGLLGQKDAIKTHCPAGHPYAGDNLALTPEGHRYCRICKRAATNASSRRRRARLRGAAS